ncbi:V-type ATP synthase subunit I [Ruoffia tabacinasalis]|uniref:V-type ATP synthase subunit I n=1 Tax=Ruoffia tabacinasalis TaxID=87458 RepID=A0A5R9DWW1_9LACT|nr:V-type ATP synthase subunit I [Ruoffia tabacinasalis]TLQ40942.1 V-type ATP synthase subunit I [Ruoffia tabacinasalis]
MAISVMKRVTIIAEQANKELLLESLQELKGIEIVPFEEVEEADLDIFFDGASLNSEDSKLNRYTLNKIEDAIEFLKQYGSQPSFIKRMREKRKVYSLQELETEVNSMNLESLLRLVSEKRSELEQLRQAITELEEKERFLRKWTNLDFSLKQSDDFKHFDVVVGSIDTEDSTEFIDNLMNVTDEVLVQEVYYTEDTSGYTIVFSKEHQEDVQEVVRRSNFTELDYEYDKLPKEELQEVLSTRKRMIEEQSELVKRFKSNRQLLSNLKLAQEYYANLIEREKASQLLLDSSHLFILKGWMDADEVSDNIVNINHVIGEDNLAIFTYDVDPEEDNLDEVPVKLKNSAFSTPFETLTLQYGTPKYNSIDPTPFFSFSQVLFFGLMSADVGYGLLLFIATFIPIMFFELDPGMRKTLKSFKYMSVGTILVGLFFGSFFGFSLPFGVMNLSSQVIEVMIFSVALGLVHLLVGYSLKFYLTLKEKDYGSSYLDALQQILMLIGGAIIAINFILEIPVLNTIGLVLLLGNVIGMIVVNMIVAKNPLIGLGQGAFGLIDLAGMIGDIVSYTRLTALAVAGANIGMAFNLIVGLLPPFVRFTVGILLFLALHALNIFITYLGAYVHSMRLQFVEFFGKFYETGGKAFKPLSPLEKEVWIQKNYNNK